MRSIITSLSPNTQSDDVLKSLKVLGNPFSWLQGPSQEKFRSAFRNWLGVENVFLFESGRSCLYSLLLSLGLKSEDQVLLQAYTCVAVPDPILWSGAKPVYIDINSQTLNMDPKDLKRKITSHSKVLIIQHTFGNPADLEELLKIARQHKLFIIEDCAHALGSEFQGRKIGSFGDAAFFSTGRDKVISSVFGGVVATNNRGVAANLARIYKDAPYPSVSWVAQQLNHVLVSTLTKPSYNFFNFGKALFSLSLKAGIISRSVYPEEKVGGKPNFVLHKMPNALCELAFHQFQKLESFNNHRSIIANIYEENLDLTKYKITKTLGDSKNIFLRYTILTPKAEEIRTKANQLGIVLGDWYTTAIAPNGVDYKILGYDPSSCPKAENTSKQSLNLPTHIGISEKNAREIVRFLNDC